MKNGIAMMMVTALSSSLFALSPACQKELQGLKRDLSNLTDKGAVCIAQNVVDELNRAKKKKNLPDDKMKIFLTKDHTFVVKTFSPKEPRKDVDLKMIKQSLLDKQCNNPMYIKLMQHGIKFKLDLTTPKQHIVIVASKKSCNIK